MSKEEGVRLTKAQAGKATWAHTNLTMFHAIIALAESGCFYGTHSELRQIVRIAKQGAQRQLRALDAALQTQEQRS